MNTVDDLSDEQYETLYAIAEDIKLIHRQAVQLQETGETEAERETAESQRTTVEAFRLACEEFEIDILAAWEEM